MISPETAFSAGSDWGDILKEGIRVGGAFAIERERLKRGFEPSDPTGAIVDRVGTPPPPPPTDTGKVAAIAAIGLAGLVVVLLLLRK